MRNCTDLMIKQRTDRADGQSQITNLSFERYVGDVCKQIIQHYTLYFLFKSIFHLSISYGLVENYESTGKSNICSTFAEANKGR